MLDIKEIAVERDESQWETLTCISSDDDFFRQTVAIWYFPCGCWFEELIDGKFHVIISNETWMEDTKEACTEHLTSNWHNRECELIMDGR